MERGEHRRNRCLEGLRPPAGGIGKRGRDACSGHGRSGSSRSRQFPATKRLERSIARVARQSPRLGPGMSRPGEFSAGEAIPVPRSGQGRPEPTSRPSRPIGRSDIPARVKFQPGNWTLASLRMISAGGMPPKTWHSAGTAHSQHAEPLPYPQPQRGRLAAPQHSGTDAEALRQGLAECLVAAGAHQGGKAWTRRAGSRGSRGWASQDDRADESDGILQSNPDRS